LSEPPSRRSRGAPVTAPAPAPPTLAALLAARAAATPDAPAFADTARQVTFGELADAAGGRAAGLARMGVRAGDRVALVLPAGVGFAEMFWALQLLGAVPCAFNPTTLRQTLARRVRSVDPTLVVSAELEIPVARAAPPEPPADPAALAFLQRTSGSSGEPRAAMLTQANVLAQLRATDDLDRDDVLVSWVPPWHDLGLVRFMIGPVWFGTACHIVRPAIRTIPDWLATISRVGATHTGAPDFAYRLASRLVDPGAVDLTSMRYAATGGEPVRRATIEQFEDRFRVPGTLAPAYGMAEATLGITAHRAGEPFVVDERGTVSCGAALPGTEVEVNGSAGAAGEIVVRGDSVFAGYFEAPGETAAALRDGWLHTGDVGYLDDAGRLFVLGRQRAMIKRGGGVIAPRELEDAAHTIPGVQFAAALGTPLSKTPTSERVSVFVEAERSDAEDAAAMTASVSDAIRHSLGFSPHDIVIVRPRTIPRTGSGKIRYGELKALLASSAGTTPG
jgi:acyl-CoA synthetase (AMP-forming)/AMP-acid ligase II